MSDTPFRQGRRTSNTPDPRRERQTSARNLCQSRSETTIETGVRIGISTPQKGSRQVKSYTGASTLGSTSRPMHARPASEWAFCIPCVGSLVTGSPAYRLIRLGAVTRRSTDSHPIELAAPVPPLYCCTPLTI